MCKSKTHSEVERAKFMENIVLITGQVVFKKVIHGKGDKIIYVTIKTVHNGWVSYPTVKIEGKMRKIADCEIQVKNWISVTAKMTKFKYKKTGEFVEEISCISYSQLMPTSPNRYRNEVRLNGVVKGIYQLTPGITTISLAVVTNPDTKKVICPNVDIYKNDNQLDINVNDRLEIDGRIVTRKKGKQYMQHILVNKYKKTELDETEVGIIRLEKE